MPPKPAASKTPAKKPTATAARPGVTKPGAKAASSTKAGSTSKDAKSTKKEPDVKKVEENMEKMSIKKIMVPEEIVLKDVAGLMTYTGDLGQKIKDSNRWMFLIDKNGNVHTFLKYRDVNMLSITSSLDFQKEPVRKALMGSLRFGKPHIIDASDVDSTKVIELVRNIYNEIYEGLWDDIMDRSILEFEKCGKLYQANDDSEYSNAFDYRVDSFQFMIYTTTDPPSTANESFFPIIIN